MVAKIKRAILKYKLALITPCVLILIFFIYILLPSPKTNSDFSEINKIVRLYKALADEDEATVASITDTPPSFNGFHMYMVPRRIKQELNSRKSKIEPAYTSEMPEYVNDINRVTKELQLKYTNIRAIEDEEKVNVFFNDFNLSEKGNEEVNYLHLMINKEYLDHDIFKIQTGNVPQGNELQKLLEDPNILGIVSDKLTIQWKDIKNFQAFQIKPNILGALYILKDAYGFNKTAVLDVYKFNEGKISAPLTTNFNFSDKSDDQLEVELIKLQGEIIRDSEGMYF